MSSLLATAGQAWQRSLLLLAGTAVLPSNQSYSARAVRSKGVDTSLQLSRDGVVMAPGASQIACAPLLNGAPALDMHSYANMLSSARHAPPSC